MAKKGDSRPLLEIVAGPNGSGKSTFAQAYLVRTLGRTNYLNPDLITAGMSPNYSTEAAFQSGRMFLIELKDRLKKKESFSFETTLSGLSYLRLIKVAQSLGFQITIYFLVTKSSRINIDRIKKRVQMGGHHIPTKDVLRRYKRSFDNFWNAYKDFVDDWTIFDNSEVKPKLIFSKEKFNQLDEDARILFQKKFLKGKFE